jgi:peptidoglycan hydrolase-like protein with peptidoglycan-binding domain
MVARMRRKPIEHKAESRQDQVIDRYPFRHPLDTGDKGALVLWAQSRLTESGHYKGALDGRYDREVSLAVRLFQSDKGLKITGVVDRKTWEAL